MRVRAAWLHDPAVAPWIARGAVALAALVFFVLAVERRWYGEDAFVTFRFAANVARGAGFTWNPGAPPVEGTPSLGWALLAALVIRLGLDPVLVSWWGGFSGGIAGLVLVYLAGRRILGLSRPWALAGVGLLFGHRAYVLGAAGALETRPATALAFGATLVLAVETRRRPGGIAWSGLLFFAATLLRPEAIVLHAAAAAVFAFASTARAAVARSLATHLGLLALLTLGRALYFGRVWPAALPETFSRASFDQGLAVLARFPAETFGWLWGPLLLVGIALAAQRLPDLGAALLAQVGAVVVLAAARGGGNAEFLALDAALPGFVLLVVLALRGLLLLRGDPPSGRRRTAIAVVTLALIGTQIATSFLPVQPVPPLRTIEQVGQEAQATVQEGQVLAQYLRPKDRLATARTGAIPFVTGTWHVDPRTVGGWRGLVEARVTIVDAFDQFLFDRLPDALPRTTVPWVGPGAHVHCVRLPRGRHPYFVFASTLDRAAIEAWASPRGLVLLKSWELPGGAESPPN
jgi:hypothetical protein